MNIDGASNDLWEEVLGRGPSVQQNLANEQKLRYKKRADRHRHTGRGLAEG